MWRSIAAVLAINFVAGPLAFPAAGDVYVSPFGDDQNSGTLADPLRTPDAGIARAIGAGAPAVYLDEGFYAASASATVPPGLAIEIGFDADTGAPAVGTVVWEMDANALAWEQGSVLAVDLGDQSDALTFGIGTGSLILDRPTLHVRPGPGFGPGVYPIVVAPSYQGSGFGPITGLDPNVYEFDLRYSDGRFELWVGLDDVADLNADGIVDRGDVAILARNYGRQEEAAPIEGDLDGDGAVSLFDLAILQASFTPAASPFAANSAAVPEPAAISLAVAAVIALLFSLPRPK